MGRECGRASRRVGRYSIAPQGSSTAGVTRPFTRPARFSSSSPRPKLAALPLLFGRLSKFADTAHVALPYAYVKARTPHCFENTSERGNTMVTNHEENGRPTNYKSQYRRLSVNHLTSVRRKRKILPHFNEEYLKATIR